MPVVANSSFRSLDYIKKEIRFRDYKSMFEFLKKETTPVMVLRMVK
jgi:hypothetical protein